jgi:hypothetical protein
VATVQAKIKIADGHESVMPVVIPDLASVRERAQQVHAVKAPWQGTIFGWQSEYVPESAERPIGSRLLFTPAEFWIGESGIWFFSMTWERGAESPASEYLDDSGIVRP